LAIAEEDHDHQIHRQQEDEHLSHEDHAHPGDDVQGHDDEDDEHGHVEKDDEHGHVDEDDEHGHDGEEIVRLDQAVLDEFGIEVDEARPGTLAAEISLPGEVRLNGDRTAHIVPYIGGIVREVRKSLGDTVRSGEVMAVLDSRELAEAKARLLGSRERLAIAEATFKREEGLWAKKITSEQEFLDARRGMVEAQIEMQSARQALYALGLDAHAVDALSENGEPLARYELRAPFGGQVVGRHISLGEYLQAEVEAFIISDLSSVWVDLSVYRQHLSDVTAGQHVRIVANGGHPQASVALDFVSPVLAEDTRTALARIVLSNSRGEWRPGTFISAHVTAGDKPTEVLIPADSIQTYEGSSVVFVETADGFVPRTVRVGRGTDTQVAIIEGLTAGERYVSKGSFTIKAELSKGAFGDGHAH